MADEKLGIVDKTTGVGNPDARNLFVLRDGGSLVSNLDAVNNRIINLLTPGASHHAANRQYVDDAIVSAIAAIPVQVVIRLAGTVNTATYNRSIFSASEAMSLSRISFVFDEAITSDAVNFFRLVFKKNNSVTIIDTPFNLAISSFTTHTIISFAPFVLVANDIINVERTVTLLGKPTPDCSIILAFNE